MTYRVQAEKQEELEDRIDLANERLSKIENRLNKSEVMLINSLNKELEQIDYNLRFYYRCLSPTGEWIGVDYADQMIKRLTSRKDILCKQLFLLKDSK